MEDDHERIALAQIEAALRSQPLAQPPATLAPAVAARIRGLTRGARLRFRLEWTDYALSLFALAMLVMGSWLWRWLPPQAAGLFATRMRLEALSLVYAFDLERLWPVLALGLGVCLAALLVSAWEFSRPRL